MQRYLSTFAGRISTAGLALILLSSSPPLFAQPTPEALAQFNTYARQTESRLAQQHRSPEAFLAAVGSDSASAALRIRHGEPAIERLPETGSELPGALLHHWRGTAFAPGATAADFEHLLRDFNSYPQHFSPQVLQAKLLSEKGDQLQASMRVRQKHVITVVIDATYNVTFGRLDARHRFTTSRSTQISEIDSPGTPAERALSSAEEHGFLWRLNTYWSYEERDGGLYLQIETISLTRSIPRGLGWAIRSYVDSIPRESLEFTLRSACAALRK